MVVTAFAAPAAANESGPAFRSPPNNIEAEQALLGAILVNNEMLNQLDSSLRPEHFFEPVHNRLFGAIQRANDKGLIANPVTLKNQFDADPALVDIGGAQYLAKLASSALAVINVRDYSQVLIDLATKRALIGVGTEMVNLAYDAASEELAAQQIERAEAELFQLASEGTVERSFQTMRDATAKSLRQTELAYKRSGAVYGVPTNLKKLDKLLGGLQKSDLLILAGRPSMGKTALALNIAYEAARSFLHDAKGDQAKAQCVAFVSLEMAAEQLAGRLLSAASGLNASSIRKGDLTNDDFAKLVEASQHIATLPMFIDDTPALSISAVRTRARRLKRVSNLGLLVVDYLQLMRGSSGRSEQNRVLEISEITMGLKAIAKELDIPVLALSQLSRAVESRDDKRPQLSDLRESGSIEQDSDVVMFVFREEYYHMRKQPREGTAEHTTWQAEMEKLHGIAEVIVAKHRHGPIDNVRLQFTADQARFSDLEFDSYVPIEDMY